MENLRSVKSALISVYNKTGLDKLVKILDEFNVSIFSTGGTYSYIEKLGVKANTIEALTSYPSILGGRVKTLHPLVFGGILGRRHVHSDLKEMQHYNIPEFDLVIVDLYPFEKTVTSTDDEGEIIDNIDIGGISLIRAAAKNFKDVLIVPSCDDFDEALKMLIANKGASSLADRKRFAAKAFNISSHYDTAIFNYFNREAGINTFKQSIDQSKELRYGENPHQKGYFFGQLEENFKQLNGKEISYNNINDLDAGIGLIKEFSDPTIAILKHNNACGLASRDNLLQAWKDALAGDPVSAFGGVIVTNRKVDVATAEEINNLFFEIILAPDYETEALDKLKSKKNRIILKGKDFATPEFVFKTSLNGVLMQQADLKTETSEDLNFVSEKKGYSELNSDLLFANKIVKHSKSNAIVLAKNKQLLASGVGQTSRVDALKQAIEKARSFNFDLKDSVMASDAFFPFADSVEIAHEAGVIAVIQPGGSIRDEDSIQYCDAHGMAMATTGFRHFKH